MYEICCIGHITSDKVVTTKSVMYMAGGTAFYFSHAVARLDVNYVLVTALAHSEMKYVTALRGHHIEIKVQPSKHTVFFENIYAENQDHRTQNVLAKADPFKLDVLQDVHAKIFHLGPLLADDMSTELIKALAAKGRISLDAQGYLRKVKNKKVHPADWPDKEQALQYVEILKADVAEMKILTGYHEIKDGAKALTGWGVKEVVITDGSKGSTIYSEGIWYDIPAYQPENPVDATGCGDTYMAGYLYKRVKGISIPEAGRFAAAMSGLKTAVPGPFTGTENDVLNFLNKNPF